MKPQRLHFNFIGADMFDAIDLALDPLYMEQPPTHQATDKGISTTLDVPGKPYRYDDQLPKVMLKHGYMTTIMPGERPQETVYIIKRLEQAPEHFANNSRTGLIGGRI